MIKTTVSRILLLGVCAAATGCSTDASRFGDFYANALPPGAVAPNGGQPGIDYTTTASVGVPGPAGAPVPSGGLVPSQTFAGAGPVQNGNVPGAPLAGQFPPNPTSVMTYPVAPSTVAGAPAAVTSNALAPIRDAVDANPVPAQTVAVPEVGRTKSIVERVRNVLPKSLPRTNPPAQVAQMTVPNDVPALNRVVSASAAPAAAAPQGGWSSGKGVKVTVRDGETLYNLSKRYGIPVSSIMAANGISDPRSVASGRTLLIPTYNYDPSASVSAPDANVDVRASRAAIGMKGEPLGAVPAPTMRRPGTVASVPVRTQTVPVQSVQAPRAPIAATPAATTSGSTVRVSSGDTLYRIASRSGTTVEALRAANGIDGNAIRVGQVLRLPNGAMPPAANNMVAAAPRAAVDPITTASVRPAEPVAPAATPRRQVVEQTAARVVEPVVVATAPAAQSQTAASGGALRWPVQGRVVKDFGGASKGVEIAVPTGSAIRAAEGGKVLYAGSGLKQLGKTVLVQHADGLVTVYGYAGELRVAKGQTVNRGDVIAASGMTGAAESPRVHFQVRKGSTPVDPTSYLN